MNYINHKGKLSLQICAFSSIDCLLEYFEHNTVDILLINEDGFSTIENLHNKIKNIYILSERQSPKEILEFPCIYKYQSAEKLMMEILELYMEKNGGKNGFLKSSESMNKKIIGVFSPKGGSKKTTLSILLSNYYGFSRKTLYINLELFSELSWLNAQGKIGFSELLYYMKQKNTNLIMKIKSIVCNHNHFDFIPAISHYQDILEMNQEDVAFLIQCLIEYSDYEVIIFDIGYFGYSVLELLNKCDKIYVPLDEDILTRDKKEAFYRQFREAKKDEILKKVEEVIIPYDSEVFDESFQINNLSEDTLYNYVTSHLKMEV